MKQQRNAAWWQVLPAVALLGLVGFIPLVAVFNYSFFDIFTLDSRFWVGTEWYAALVGTRLPSLSRKIPLPKARY